MSSENTYEQQQDDKQQAVQPRRRNLRALPAIGLGHLLGLFALGLGAANADAQSILVRDITIKRVSLAGSVAGCSVNFDVGYQDHTHRPGLASLVSGGITWYVRPLGAWATLKVVGQDISEAMAPMSPFQVTNAFIDVDTSTYLADEQSTCEHPQGFCAVYRSEKALRLMHSALPAFVLGFNRQATGMGNIRVPIVLEEPQRKEFAACMDAMVAGVTPEQP
jgi:hypothetical protein